MGQVFITSVDGIECLKVKADAKTEAGRNKPHSRRADLKLRNLLVAVFVSSVVLLTGCVSADYAPPTASNDTSNYTKIVKRSYDDVWDSLIQYSAGTFFAIDNFEKDSGLITLDFGSGEPERFITGGHWKFSNGTINFDGEYVEFLSRRHGGKLNGKMNIVVTKIDAETSKITVNARYIFSAGSQQGGYNTWTFDSGSCDVVSVTNAVPGTGSSRTICATYKAEKAILSAM